MDISELIEQFVRMNNLLNEMNKDILKLDGISPVTRGEIHLIESIGKHPDYNMSQIAAKLKRKDLSLRKEEQIMIKRLSLP